MLTQTVGTRFDRLIDALLKTNKTDNQLAEAVFLAALGRLPTEVEEKATREHLAKHKDRKAGLRDAFYLLINTKEFRVHLEALNKLNDGGGRKGP